MLRYSRKLDPSLANPHRNLPLSGTHVNKLHYLESDKSETSDFSKLMTCFPAFHHESFVSPDSPDARKERV